MNLLRGAACLVLVSGALALAMASFGSLHALPDSHVRPHERVSSPAAVPPYNADSLAHRIISRNMMRHTRRPASLAFDPDRPEPAPSQVAPPKPVLQLLGVVAGDDPTAVIAGFPGVDGSRVVRRGDHVAGLLVARIGNGEVLVTGLDTTWVLRLREQW